MKNNNLVSQALEGTFYTDGRAGYIVNKDGVATFNKSRDQYQIMKNGSWRKISNKKKEII